MKFTVAKDASLKSHQQYNGFHRLDYPKSNHQMHELIEKITVALIFQHKCPLSTGFIATYKQSYIKHHPLYVLTTKLTLKEALKEVLTQKPCKNEIPETLILLSGLSLKTYQSMMFTTHTTPHMIVNSICKNDIILEQHFN